MTGFRVARGGAQELYGVMPDITCLGKIIGGGLPVGAYGGSRELMRNIAPAGSIYQAGTLSGNPLAMVAGLLTLRRLNEPDDLPKSRTSFSKTLCWAFASGERCWGYDGHQPGRVNVDNVSLRKSQ